VARNPLAYVVALVLAFGVVRSEASAQGGEVHRSHPPLRKAPPPAKRPLAQGPAFFVDAQKGDDSKKGSKDAPWKTLGHAIKQLKAGDTLYLRGGTYYETLAIRLVGAKDAPISLRSFPGEQAILDGGMREFFEAPADSWEPAPGGAVGEYRSRRAYPNLRHVIASFGDSMVGLQSYYHAEDLRATRETVEMNEQKTDVKPLYCGPGLWYDRRTGILHARLAHTNLSDMENYRGEQDPRKLRLVIAPYASLPLHLDGAEHVRFQDLVIRGGGYDTVVLDQSSDIEFDNVTVWCGTYGLRATGARRLKFYRSALYGSIAPWTTRFESGFNTYPGRTQRDITRLNTHALLVTAANPEFSVYHSPFNDDWEISYSEFTDASDGLYLGGVGMRFHHNIVYNMHDDGIYLSPMFQRSKVFGGGATLHLYQNYLGRCLTMLAFGGTEANHDTVYFYRNVVDLRAPIWTGRPGAKSPRPSSRTGKLTGDHGSPPWSSMFTYHNTFVIASQGYTADMWMARGAVKERPRKVFNNIFVHTQQLPAVNLLDSPDLQVDGNVYWHPGTPAKQTASFFAKYRASPAYEKSKKVYPPGFDTNSLIADPQLMKVGGDLMTMNDYRLKPGSPAVNAGVELPADWPDPLRKLDQGKADIGAYPLGSETWKVGRAGHE
jgi:hypothetical protein